MYESKMSDEDFEQLLEEMDKVGRQADELHNRVSKLIEEMREELPAPAPENEDDEQ